jgi:tetratricopeptide (TPR) repeat protein
MNFLYAIVSIFLLAFSPVGVFAAEQGADPSQLVLRSNNHDGFTRIVMEGPESLLAAGQVNRTEKEVIVRFAGSDFVAQKGKINIPYQKNNDALIFEMKDIGDMKVFSLRGPGRLVIDVYKKVKAVKTRRADNKIKKNANKKNIKEEKKNDNNPPVIVQEGTAHISAKNEGKKQNTSLSLFGAEAEASTIHERSTQANAQQADEKNEANSEEKVSGDDDFIPDSFKKTWELLKKDNNPYRVITEFSAFKPSDAASLAAYHFIYGEAFDAAKQYFAAIEQLRLAYIYASHEKLKELALFRRAEVYMKLGFFYEAKCNFSVFLKDFSSSKYTPRAHLGLANSLSETGLFAEAVEHYEKAGKDPEVLFNMANALQKLERVEDARKAYTNAMLADSSYPEKSPETYFLFAENLRMSGNLNEAKKLLLTIESGPFRDSARVSLGLIAMDESNLNEATAYFKSVIFSRNMKVKVNALFNLSLAYLKVGKLKDSILTLEEIRKNYPDSSMYDEALLVLSKLYRQEGKIKESVALLKELVYGKEPPKEAFTELEEILTEASEKPGIGEGGEVKFKDLWREVGQWLLDETRGDFLLKVARKLKPEGKPFLQLCSWLAENASGKVRITAAIDLADYYAGLENTGAAERYMNIVRETSRELKVKESNDVMLRVEARISHAGKKSDAALKDLMSVKEFDSRDFRLLGDIINEMKESGGNIQQGVAFYEKMLNKTGGEAEDYVRLGDILYEQNEQKALVYYRTAHEKNPEDEWTMYRIGLIVDMPETNEMFSKLQKGDSLISRVAKTKLKEISLLNKIEEVYQ